MKRIMWFGLVMAVSICLTGCTTGKANGRLTLLNWDSRDKDQLTAAQYTDGAVYGAQPTQTNGAEARGFTAWTELFELVKSLKIKLQFLAIEWSYDSSPACEATKVVAKPPASPVKTEAKPTPLAKPPVVKK